MKFINRLVQKLKKQDPRSLIGAGPDALASQPKGLQKAFTVGEQIPWKGIWFQVMTVGEDHIVFYPVSTTWKRAKQIKEMKEKTAYAGK